MNGKRALNAAMIAIIVLGSLIYSNSLTGKFVWDDEFLVRDNTYIKELSNAGKIFLHDIGAGGARKFSSYRPLQMLTYMADYSLWKLDVRGCLLMRSREGGVLPMENPTRDYPFMNSRGQGAPHNEEASVWGYHITNIILHILVALCILWLVFLLFGNPLLAFLTAAFFVAHPIHTEAVSYISGRADPLAALFMLLAFIFYIKNLTIPMALSYILALLSRENSLILPFLILLYHAVFKERLSKRNFSFLLVIASCYIALRLTVLKALLTHTASPTTAFERLPGFFVALTTYVRLLILPFNLHMEYGNRTFPLLDPRTLIGILIFAFLVVSLIRMRRSSLMAFSLGFFVIALLPSSNLYPLNAYMAEHWLYLPSIGFFLILAKGVCELRRRHFIYPALGLASVLVVAWSSLTILQNRYWREPISFYERTRADSPESATVQNNLGNAYKDLGKREMAIASYRKAIALDPTFAPPYYNLGVVQRDCGKSEDAIALFKKTLEINPEFVEAYNNLGLTYSSINKKEEAIASYKKAIELNPHFVFAYHNLGLAYSDIGKKDKAIASFKEAIAIRPDFVESYVNLGIIYSSIGKTQDAVSLFKKAIGMAPKNAHAYNNLGTLYAAEGKKEEAIALFEKAVAIDPALADVYNNLGLAYTDPGKKEAAYKKAIALKPDYADAYNNLGILYGMKGKKEEAITAYEKAIQVDPKYAKAYYNLGFAYGETGKRQDAIVLFKKAIEIDPGYAKAYNNLSILFFQEKQHQLAIEYCDKAKALGFANPELLEALAPYREK